MQCCYINVYSFCCRMMPSNLQQREVEWQRLNSLLKSYEKLYSEEQSFLVEVK